MMTFMSSSCCCCIAVKIFSEVVVWMAFANALRSKRIHRAHRFGMRRSATNRSSASRRVLTLASGRVPHPYPCSVRLAFGLMLLNGLNAAQARSGTECVCVCVSVDVTTGRRFNFDRQNAPTRLGLSFCSIPRCCRS